MDIVKFEPPTEFVRDSEELDESSHGLLKRFKVNIKADEDTLVEVLEAAAEQLAPFSSRVDSSARKK